MSEAFGIWGYSGIHSNPAQEPRRLAIIRVAPEFVLMFLQDLGHRRVTAAGIPADAQVVSADYDPARRNFLILLESEEFKAMPHGAHAPEINVMLTDHGPYVPEIPDSA